MKIKIILEWALIAAVLLTFFVWVSYTRPAQAQGYYEEDQGGLWMDPNAPVQPYERRPHPIYREQRSRMYDYTGSEPYYYGPVDQQPELIIYRGRRFTTH